MTIHGGQVRRCVGAGGGAVLVAVLIMAAVAPAATADAPPPDTEHTTRQVVVLQQGASTADLADLTDSATSLARHGPRPDHVYTQTFRGYAADLTAAEAATLADDPRVAAVVPDRPFSIPGEASARPAARERGSARAPIPGTGGPPSAAPDAPTEDPTDEPTDAPTEDPTDAPTDEPTDDPTDDPTDEPTGQVVSTGLQRIGGLDRTPTGADGANGPVDADIAILDSGIDASHPDLTVAGEVDCSGSGSTAPVHEHGTHLAGIAAAIDNDLGVVGVAPGARIWSIRVADDNGQILLSYLLCATDWVAANADTIEVANVSLSGSLIGPTADCGISDGVLVDPLHQSICAGVDAGVTYAVAAGNHEADASTVVPAAYPEVLTVSAYSDFDGLPGGESEPDCLGEPLNEEDDTFAFFSNHGPLVDMAAPGVCIVSTFPGGGLGVMHGTSMAAPHVAGAAALVAASDPSLTPAQIREILLGAGEPGPLAQDPDTYPEPLVHVSGF